MNPPFLLALLQLAASREVGSAACAPCHRAIFDSYSRTGMAGTSGRAGQGAFQESLESASFPVPGGSARMSRDGRNLSFVFEPTGAPPAPRKIDWFIGSGRVGRNYAYSVDGYLFQAPASYYTSASSFGLSPGYQNRAEIEMTRPVEPACLQCHASRPRPIAGTQNRYESEPFLESGISCERCHGPGARHIETMARNPKAAARAIVNPARLDPARRDSVCAQCHLTGAARVARAAPSRYVPGALLSDSVAVFVWDGPPGRTSATSHYERLAASACRKAAGDKLWCGTCHSVHEGKTTANAACQSCHAAPKHPATVNGADCAGCHMPKAETRLGDHLAYTDHFIPREPGGEEPAVPRGELIPFGSARYDDRDTALAYAVAAYTEPRARRAAFSLLESAAAANPRDASVLAQLALFNDRMGREDRAFELAQRAVSLDPSQAGTAVNLGGYLAKRGRPQEAIALWRAALERNTGLIAARVNLAVALHQTGDRAGAESELRRVLELEPAHAQARALLAEVQRSR